MAIKGVAILGVIQLSCLLGCALPEREMRQAFQESLSATVGRTLGELKQHPSRAFIGQREPTEVRALPNGNNLHVYGDYWGQYGIEREACAVYLEVVPDTTTVVSASAEGNGCYRAY